MMRKKAESFSPVGSDAKGKEMLNHLEKIHTQIRPAVETYFSRWVNRFGERLDSIYLYGSVVTEDFIPGRSDVNSLVLFDEFVFATAQQVKPMIRDGLKNHIIAPLCLSVETLFRSTDTFPLELIEIQDKNLQIHGSENRVRELVIPRERVRVKVEEQIKGKLIRLCQFYMEHAGPEKRLFEVMMETQRALFPVFRNFLRFVGVEPPPLHKQDILNELEKRTQSDLRPCRRVWDHMRGLAAIPAGEAEKTLGEYMDVLLHLAQTIDRLEKS